MSAWIALGLRWSLLGSTLAVMGWAVYLTFSGGRRWLGYRRLERRRKALSAPLELTVLDRQDHGPFVRLWLGSANGIDQLLPPFEAGDYLVLASPARQRRCYSLAGWQTSPRQYELVIKHEEGGAVSGWAHRDLHPGQRVHTVPPRGSFHMAPARRGVHALVAAGVGITPLRAMLHQYLGSRRKAPVTLFWTVRHVNDLMVFHEEFLDLAQRHSHFHYAPHVTGPAETWTGARSRVDAQALLQKAGGADQLAGVWICASIAMVERLQSDLLAQGVRPGQIHHEAFGGAAPATARDCQVEVLPEGRKLHFQSQPSLLHLLEEAALPMASECRTGQCGLCLLTLQSGGVEWVTHPEQRPPEHQVLACCVRPLNDIRVRLHVAPNHSQPVRFDN